MSEENYTTTLSQVIPKLRREGYNSDFDLVKGGILSRHTNEVFQSNEIVIERVFRFEGDSNPDDMSVLYGVKANTGTKGIIIDAYGTYDNVELGDFLRYVAVCNVSPEYNKKF